MNTIAPQLPTILGSFAAMLVAFLSLINGTSPGTCLIKAAAAFLVFAGFGLVLRYVLLDSLIDNSARQTSESAATSARSSSLDVILPGTPVGDLLSGGQFGEEESALNGDPAV